MSEEALLTLEDLLENPSERTPSTKGTVYELARKHFQKVLEDALNKYNIPFKDLRVRFEVDIIYDRFKVEAMWKQYEIIQVKGRQVTLEKKSYGIAQTFTHEAMASLGSNAGELFITMLEQLKKEVEQHCMKLSLSYLKVGVNLNTIKAIVHSNNYAHNIVVTV